MDTFSRSVACVSAPRLLVTPPPYADESLPGYLVRLTEANGYQLSWWLPLAGLSRHLFTAGWESLLRPATDFTQLAQCTGRAVTVFDEWRWATLAAGVLDFSRPQVCGRCLGEAAYCRRVWDERAVTVCPRHHVRLWEVCPVCQQPLRWRRSLVNVCHCGTDWRHFPTLELPAAERQANVWLQEEAAVASSGWPPLTYVERSRLLLALAPFTTASTQRSPARASRSHAALEAAATVLLGGPAAFRRFCAAQSPCRELWQLAAVLKQLAEQPALAFLCMLLEAQLRTGELAPTYDWEARFLILAEVCQRLAFSPAQGKQLLAAGQFTLYSDTGLPSRARPSQVWIDVRQLNEKVAARRALHTLDEVASALGLTLREVADLRRWDCLPAASGPALDGFPDWRCAPAALTQLTQRLTKLAVSSTAAHHTMTETVSWCTLEDMRLHVEAYRLSFGQWLQAVLSGECPFHQLPPRNASLLAHWQAMRFQPVGIAAYLARHHLPPLFLFPPEPTVNAATPFCLAAAARALEQQWECTQRQATRHTPPYFDPLTLRRAAHFCFTKTATQETKNERGKPP
jgi:hypothetical protein